MCVCVWRPFGAGGASFCGGADKGAGIQAVAASLGLLTAGGLAAMATWTSPAAVVVAAMRTAAVAGDEGKGDAACRQLRALTLLLAAVWTAAAALRWWLCCSRPRCRVLHNMQRGKQRSELPAAV
jgi:hypothetical protein